MSTDALNAVSQSADSRSTNDLYDVLHRRRDVRAEFTGGPIAPDVLDRVLRAAHAARAWG